MSEWIHDRPPRNDEMKDNDLTFVTIRKEALGVVSKFVCRMSGFNIKAYFGEEWRFTETIIAWLPKPEPWDEDKEAAEAAAVVAAMRHDAKARDLIQKENGDAASRS